MFRRCVWLVPLLHAPSRPGIDDPAKHLGWVGTRQGGCDLIVEPAPKFLVEPIRLGLAPGSLPYTMDGRTSAYTLTHLR